jgi:O-methyltransferase
MKGRAQMHTWVESQDLPPIFGRIRPYTMVSNDSLLDLARQVRVILEHNIPGAFVECGTWKGGSSFLMAELLKHAGETPRSVWMFDSFEGIQPPRQIDGPTARQWAENKEGQFYYDNLRAPVEEVRAVSESLRIDRYTRIVPGWFDKTLPQTVVDIGPIALLRIDADWHSSVLCCLDNLFDRVVNEGVIIIDDYYTWDGCTVAVHEFLGRRHSHFRLESTGFPYPTSAVIRKAKTTWHWMEQVYLLGQDFAVNTPANARILIADDDICRSLIFTDRTLIPLIEHDGQYGGPPTDDAAAILYLDSQRQHGESATYLALAFPSFWWIDHYPQWWQSLKISARSVVDNDRLKLFALASR